MYLLLMQIDLNELLFIEFTTEIITKEEVSSVTNRGPSLEQITKNLVSKEGGLLMKIYTNPP